MCLNGCLLDGKTIQRDGHKSPTFLPLRVWTPQPLELSQICATNTARGAGEGVVELQPQHCPHCWKSYMSILSRFIDSVSLVWIAKRWRGVALENGRRLKCKWKNIFTFVFLCPFAFPSLSSHALTPSRPESSWRLLTKDRNARWGKCHHTNKGMSGKRNVKRCRLAFKRFPLIYRALFLCDRWHIKYDEDIQNGWERTYLNKEGMFVLKTIQNIMQPNPSTHIVNRGNSVW